jgi:hypothetical protein
MSGLQDVQGTRRVPAKQELQGRLAAALETALAGGVCAICGRADPEHVDHSHETGAVRGILCFNCNGGLGQFRDSIDALHAAAAYLDAVLPEAVGLTELTRDRIRALVGVSG